MNQPVPDELPKPNGAEASTIAPCSVSTRVPPLKPPPVTTVPEGHFASNCSPVLGGISVAGPTTSVDTTQELSWALLLLHWLDSELLYQEEKEEGHSY